MRVRGTWFSPGGDLVEGDRTSRWFRSLLPNDQAWDLSPCNSCPFPSCWGAHLDPPLSEGEGCSGDDPQEEEEGPTHRVEGS